MMAVAEARAVWQRTANRCFVQEDAKRAPKLACCPQASSSAKQVDTGPASAVDGQDNFSSGFVPLNRKTSHSNLSPDSIWWLQLQPNHAYQRGLTNEQINTLEAEVETIRASKISKVQQQTEGGDAGLATTRNCKLSIDTHGGISGSGTKKDFVVMNQELKSHSGEESYELVEMDSVGSKELSELSLDSEFSWIGGEKSEPWWRTADRDELASLIAQRSLDLIENCDLPQPQNIKKFKMDPYARVGCLDRDEIFTSSNDWKSQIVGCPNTTIRNKGNCISGSASRRNQASVETLSKSSSCKPMSEMPIFEIDPSKAQLLEALRHSQTRARKAERAAKEAYAEKEHIVKLFLKQASHLFAYKQWFHLLQLENLYIRIKNNKSQQTYPLFPVLLPRVPRKTRKMNKNWQKPPPDKGKIRAKRGHPRYEHDISKYAVVFALGLSLVSAGLLLGWTVGWMLPAF